VFLLETAEKDGVHDLNTGVEGRRAGSEELQQFNNTDCYRMLVFIISFFFLYSGAKLTL